MVALNGAPIGDTELVGEMLAALGLGELMLGLQRSGAVAAAGSSGGAHGAPGATHTARLLKTPLTPPLMGLTLADGNRVTAVAKGSVVSKSVSK